MDRETIIKLAREVYGEHTKWEGTTLERLERLINLAAEHEREKQGEAFQRILTAIQKETRDDEREACAKVCDAKVQSFTAISEHRPALAVGICAAAIRARGTP
jgi:hypothetical protein